MPMAKLKNEQKEKVAVMLSFSSKLQNAYLLKEYFHDFMASQSKAEAKERLRWFRLLAENLQIDEFSSCIRILKNSNGFTEGINNSIKVIKRTGFGYRNFHNFRKRILLIHNH